MNTSGRIFGGPGADLMQPMVLISYCQEDEEWKQRLVRHLRVLERHGLLDVWDSTKIMAGADCAEEFRQAVCRATIAVLLISADYLTSDFVLHDEIPALLKRRQRDGLVVVPVLVRPCMWTAVPWLAKMPFPVPHSHPLAVLTDALAEAMLVEIATTVLRMTKIGATHRDTTGAPAPFGGLAPNNLPPRRDLVARERELEALHGLLRARKGRGGTHASIWGLGGVGKTALALEYAHGALERGDYPGGVWWVPAEGRPADSMRRLEAALRVNVPRLLDRVDGTTTGMVRSVRREMEKLAQPSLLILDNVSQRGFSSILPQGEVRVLATTRELALAVGQSLQLDVLSADDACALAMGVEGRAHQAEGSFRRVISGLLGGLPVAVEVAARAVKLWAGSWDRYEKLLLDEPRKALDRERDRSEDYPPGVGAAIDASIARCSATTRSLLAALVAFSPHGVELSWAFAVAQLDPDGSDALASLGELEGLSLVKVDQDTMVADVHPLVHAHVRARADPAAWVRTSERAARVFALWIRAQREPSGAVSGRASEDETSRWARVARELSSLFEIQSGSQSIDAHRAHANEALAAARRCGDATTFCEITNELALHLKQCEEKDEASRLLQQALEFAEEAGHCEHPQPALTLSNVAASLCHAGDSARAAPLLEHALALWERKHPPEHPMVIWSLTFLQTAYRVTGRESMARPLLERLLPALERTRGERHPDVAFYRLDLASVLWQTGNTIEARPLFERALEVLAESWGPDHGLVVAQRRQLERLVRELEG